MHTGSRTTIRLHCLAAVMGHNALSETAGGPGRGQPLRRVTQNSNSGWQLALIICIVDIQMAQSGRGSVRCAVI